MTMASIQKSILLAIFGCFLFFLSGHVASVELPDITPESKLTDIVEYHLKNGIHELIPTPDRELFYEQYYESYDALSGINVVELLDLLGTGNPDNKTCQMCNSVIGLGKTLLQSREIVVGLLGGLCKDTDSFSRRACLGVLERMADPVIWLFKNTKLQKEEICSLLTGHECLKFLGFESDKNIFWELSLPAKKEFKPLTPPANSKNKKILHLTDIHLDLWYEAGSNASCNEPLCCRPSSEDTKGIGHITGHWSEVKGSCDTPVHFVADSLKHIARAHPDLDAIFWTGDNVPHDVWNTTQKVNLLHIHTVTKIVAEAFPNIPVFPVLGNHEAHPINLYIPQSVAEQTNGTFSMKWLYETLTNDYWSKWIDTSEAKKTYLKAGYYSKMLQPNWKVIVLNTNIPQKENFWIMAEPMDPDGHLDWLIKELDHAESIGAYVTLLGHIPPKHGIFDAWMHNYRVFKKYGVTWPSKKLENRMLQI